MCACVHAHTTIYACQVHPLFPGPLGMYQHTPSYAPHLTTSIAYKALIHTHAIIHSSQIGMIVYIRRVWIERIWVNIYVRKTIAASDLILFSLTHAGTHTCCKIYTQTYILCAHSLIVCYSAQGALHFSICYLSGWSTTPCPPFSLVIPHIAAWFVGQL